MSSMKIVLCLVFVVALLHTTTARASNIILDQFQNDLDELDAKNEDPTVVNILNLLNIHIQRDKSGFNVSTLDWYKTTEHPPLTTRPMRILIVISSFEGLYMNSGIGSFYAALSEFLASEGHTVTLLYTRMEDSESMLFTRWQNNYKRKGISITRLDESPVQITNSLNVQKSYQVYTYLKQHSQDFDVVQFPDFGGAAYYSLLAKREGLAFGSIKFIVGLHGSLRWINRMESDYDITSVDNLEQEFMEQRSAELADVLWAPSAEIVDWLSKQGWTLPSTSSGNFFLMPLLPVSSELPRSVVRPSKVKEIVFFGKLQTSKGLELFCDALDLIASSRADLATLKITFLGKVTTIDGTPADEYIQNRAQSGWKFKVNLFSKDRKGALDYIRDPSRAVVIPSFFDNAPYTLYECLYSGVAFVASNIPSIAAVIHSEDREKVLFDANVSSSLSAKILELIDVGIPAARPLHSLPDAKDNWMTLYESLTAAPVSPVTVSTKTPLVSVCLTHYNRPELLKMAIKSIEEQTYKNIELVLVDDGSTDPAAISYLNSLEKQFKAKNWKIERTANQFLGAARNHAVNKSSGEYIVFLDDDNYVKPYQVATYVRVAEATGADALTSIHDVFEGFEVPDEQTRIKTRSIPLGAAAAVGLFKNCFGDANFFIKKSVFTTLGGFTLDRDVGQEDREFLAKLVLAGHSLEVVPEPLLYYRMHNEGDQMRTNTDQPKNQIRGVRSYEPILAKGSYTVENVAQKVNKRAPAGQTCNMTISSINPQLISTGTRPTITFRVSVLDCPIQTVQIGTYQCTNIQTQQSPSGSSFTCVSPSITYPGTYSVTVTFSTGGVYRASQQILYVQNQQSGMTTSSGLGVVQYSPSTRARALTTCPFEAQFDTIACTLESISCVAQGPLVELSACTFDSSTGYYSIKVSFIGNGSPTAQQLIQLFETQLNNSAWGAIGIKFITFSATGSCTPSGCVCNPNYEGVDCSIQAQCPSNCTNRGTCVDGTYSRLCQCYSGYTGVDCSITACPNDCSGHGTCVVTLGATTGICSCNPGFTGSSCANGSSTCPDACSGHGTCIGTSCVCNTGYHGANCATMYSSIVEGQQVVAESSGETRNSKAALGATIAVLGLFLIVVLVLAYAVWKKRRNERR